MKIAVKKIYIYQVTMDRESENVDLVPDNFDQEYSVEKSNIHQHLTVDTKSVKAQRNISAWCDVE
jgi:hypothetical protein